MAEGNRFVPNYPPDSLFSVVKSKPPTGKLRMAPRSTQGPTRTALINGANSEQVPYFSRDAQLRETIEAAIAGLYGAVGASAELMGPSLSAAALSSSPARSSFPASTD